MALKYRPEIDGLRALAVVPVILFHAGILGFGGGFLGVDIFFVISGYLISSIIMSDLDGGHFSILNFYERRARRILPALFVVVLACLPFAALLLIPSLFENFGESVLAVAFSASNFLFWHGSGYFGLESSSIPLLHTWSLAVEEQFYILFPLLLLGLSKTSTRFRNISLALLFVASLLVCEWASRSAPAANFYLLPGRAWELLLGVGCALLLARGRLRVPSGAGSALGLFGLVAVVSSMVLFDRSDRLPSLLSLVPTFGAALVILFAANGTPTARLLSTGPLVAIGLSSYSTYLWHYPILVFSRFALGAEPSSGQDAILVAATFAIGFFSWRFVERPFRNRSTFNSAYIFRFSAAGVGALLVSGLFVASTNGLASFRFGPDAAKYVLSYRKVLLGGVNKLWSGQCDFYDGATRELRSGIDKSCTDAPPDKNTVFLWGDSHMEALSPGLRDFFERAGWFVAQVATAGCRPTLSSVPISPGQACNSSNAFALREIARLKPSLVLMAQRQDHEKTDWNAMTDKLRSLGVKRIILFGPAPQWRQPLPELVFYGSRENKDRIGLLDPRMLITDREMQIRMRLSATLEYISILNELCDPTGCLFRVPGREDTDLMALDYGHMSPLGAAYFVNRVSSRLLPSH